MLISLLALLPAASAWGPVPSFDCAMRKLAYQYGKQLIPRMGKFESLYYALNLNNHSDCPGVALESSNHMNAASIDTPLPEGMKLFVHPVSGHDDNLGTIKSPFRTIQTALDRAALVNPTPAVVLRGGIHYITDTLILTPKHSGLHLIGYPGEKPTISGGIELKDLSWEPYNVSAPGISKSSNPSRHLHSSYEKHREWITQANYTYIPGYRTKLPQFPTLGRNISSVKHCQKLCNENKKCHAYVWHDQHQGDYAHVCLGRLDGYYVPSPYRGHFSGRDSTATPVPSPPPPEPPAPGPPNIYVAKVKGHFHEGIPGLIIDGKRATIARYPNQPGGVEASCGYGCMISGDYAEWTPPDFNRAKRVKYYTDMNPAHKRNDSTMGGGLDEWFSHYMIGVGGLCDVYDPPVSYWCSEYTSGGGAFAFRTPRGVTPKPGEMENTPYANPEQARFFVWRPARWVSEWIGGEA